MFRALVLVSLIVAIQAKRLTPNETAELISKYAKVAKWGTGDNHTGSRFTEGRSNSGQALWAHRADVNIISSQNSKPKVVHQYPVYRKPSAKVDHVKIEKIPAVGEVIQDRFNVKPYFGYGQIPPSNPDSATFAPPPRSPPVQPPSKPSAAAPPASFPAVFNVALASAKPPVDLYTSPYSSYNPPADTNSANAYPPAGGVDSYPPAGGVDSYAVPPSTGDGPYEDRNAQQPPKASPATLGPPLSPGQDSFDYKDDHHDHHQHYEEVDAPASSHESHDHDNLPGSDDTSSDVSGHLPDQSHSAADGPPSHPPKNIEDIYYPPDFPRSEEHPKAVDSVLHGDTSHLALQGYHDSFPKYLYDTPHYDHHVYEEIPHVTTEATEDKRVSSTHYSYYYLGRKLWYIPLYFSIYFMFYVTALILKSIARHKIELKHEWATSHSRSARQMTLDQIQTVDNFHKNITKALDSAQKMYNDIAM